MTSHSPSDRAAREGASYRHAGCSSTTASIISGTIVHEPCARSRTHRHPPAVGRARAGKPGMSTLFPTTLVGSYPQPEWLIDRQLLAANTPPRVRMRQLWRVAPEFLEQAQDDATLIAIRDQERAGIDIVSDGEMRRESYFNRFATALDGPTSIIPVP